MRNLAKVVSRASYNAELSTIRNPANGRLCQFSTEKVELTETSTKKRKPKVDERTLLAMMAIKKHYASRRERYDRYFRVLDKEAAGRFADMIMSHPAVNPSYVAELSPSFGYLTRELLDAGVPKINLFEKIEHFHPDLTRIQEEYPGRVNVKNVSFNEVCLAGFRDLLYGTNMLDELLHNVEERSWEAEPTVHVIGTVPDNVLMSRILSMAIHRSALGKYGRMVLHLAMPENLWATMSSGNTNYRYYTSRGILFQILFDYRVLGTLPRAAFWPKFTAKSTKTSRRPKFDINTMCVVRMEAKCDLCQLGLTKKDIVPLSHFIKHQYKRRTGRIIPELERWVPGCGRELIAAGYDVTTQFGELLPDEIVKLFLMFKSWPGYKKSPFMSMLDTFPKKIDEETVLGTTSDKIEEMFRVSKEAFTAQTQLESSQRQDKSADKPN